MSDSIISVEGLGKRYRLGASRSSERYTALRDVVAEAAARPFRNLSRKFKSKNGASNLSVSESQRLSVSRPSDEFWALKDVSFEVKQGEVLGIIGRNGAGKSTLLKILSRITEPTEGRIRIKGRVASLLEVGTGFHPELTGRENIYLNGAILGMARSEIKAKFDEIVAFAEVERFLDTPVKRYSSGMYVRLAFAVAAHLEPEILVIDEVLAVGDAEFQKKCLNKMQEVSQGGRTVLFVSHNMTSVMNLCGTGILLETGRVALMGDIKKVVARYLSIDENTAGFQPRGEQRMGDKQVAIQGFEVRPTNVRTGAPVEFVFALERSDASGRDLSAEFAISVVTETGSRVLHLHSYDMGLRFEIPVGRSQVVARVDPLVLAPGRYWLNLWVGSGNRPYDWIPESFFLSVDPGGFTADFFAQPREYPVILPAKWEQTLQPDYPLRDARVHG